jgi:hypothetical protein
VSCLVYAEITRDGGVASCCPSGVSASRVRRGCYVLGGLPLGRWSRRSTIYVQPKPLPPGDCATMGAAFGTDCQTIHTYAVVSLDELRVDDDGQLRWVEQTEAADADFSVYVY